MVIGGDKMRSRARFTGSDDCIEFYAELCILRANTKTVAIELYGV